MQNINTSAFINNLKLQRQKIIISTLWLLGLVAGKYIAHIRPWDFISSEVFLDSAGMQPVNVLLTASTVLVGCLACAISDRLLYLLLFLKTMIYSVVSINVMTVFGEAGWLLRILLLSAETTQLAVLLLFSLRSAGQGFDTIKRNAMVAAIVSLILVLLDTYLATPFTTSLLNS